MSIGTRSGCPEDSVAAGAGPRIGRTAGSLLVSLGVAALGTCLQVHGASGQAAAALPAPSGASPQAQAASCQSEAHAPVADSVAALFDEARFVFFGSTHGGVKRHEFLLCLLSRPAFQERVTDVVVEFVSGARQELADRYLIELEEVPEHELRPLVFDTDRPPLWATIPQVPEFLSAVREMNAGRERSRRIRVLGGSATVRWDEVERAEDLASYPFKTNWAAHLITEHLAPDPSARTFVVYGDGHIQHGGTLTGDVEAVLDSDSLLVVGTITAPEEGEGERIAAFGIPDAPFFLRDVDFPSVERLPDALVPIVTSSRRSRAEAEEHTEILAERIDALVYLGPSPDRNLQGSIPLSDAERRELERRNRINGRAALEIRYGGRARWFEAHPEDLPPDPRRR